MFHVKQSTSKTRKRYKTGSRSEAIRLMAMCAIRDQGALIDALTPPAYITVDPDSETGKQIQDCRDWIEDFRRIARSAKSS